MKLQCISAYANKPLKVAYAEGDVFEVDEKVGQHLLSDSPDSFINVSALEAAEQAMLELQSKLEQKPDDPAGQPPPDPQQGQAPDNQTSEPKGKKKATE
ncbi:hypothetical protein [Herpetosiphon geysericola]|uniref:Uncharacterized protein n=1 Tax=Herpetosiphon geysericola TaxID=70996 RepID=A0A0P6Y277_9CHLR|nr:hypothetical protein [Herpetosiphon geysericola]KPL89989.1 hypothetical protein SE18_08520 [Herpetosiphon geysericola]